MRTILLAFFIILFGIGYSLKSLARPLETFEDIPDTGLVFETCQGLECTDEALDLELSELVDIKAIKDVKVRPYERPSN